MDLYHYTDRISGAEIQRDGVIRAEPLTLHRDMLARDEGMETEPIVWLSTDTRWDETVALKLRSGGWAYPPHGHLWRIVVEPTVEAYMLDAYSEAAGIAWDWWTWVIRTAEMAGTDWREWRIVAGDIPAEQWERMQELTTGGYWMPVNSTRKE